MGTDFGAVLAASGGATTDLLSRVCVGADADAATDHQAGQTGHVVAGPEPGPVART
jgi:hypothetical protein